MRTVSGVILGIVVLAVPGVVRAETVLTCTVTVAMFGAPNYRHDATIALHPLIVLPPATFGATLVGQRRYTLLVRPREYHTDRRLSCHPAAAS